MNLTELIDRLKSIENDQGDIPCLIEVSLDYVSTDMEVDELAVEDRDGYGISVKFLM